MAIDTARNNFLGALHQRFALLECVGFHGNSCVMIFAAMQARPQAAQIVSENPICRRKGQACKIKRAASRYNSQPAELCDRDMVSGDMPGRPGAERAAALPRV